jgi:3-phosphoshikimate 1-carboxyvinyltransferase
MTAVSVLADNDVILDGTRQLKERPIAELIEALRDGGIEIETHNNHELLPLRIKPGKFSGGNMEISGKETSQFASSLLLIAPFAAKDLHLMVKNLKSAPYLDITIDLMKKFGVSVEKVGNTFRLKSGQQYKACYCPVEGDFSSASYFWAAGLITGSTIAVGNLNRKSVQGDRYILEILKKMGAKIEESRNKIIVEGGDLHAINIDMADYPDIVPTVSVLAAFARGRSVIRNIAHLRRKESDRIKALETELTKMGVKIVSTDDSMMIDGSRVHGAVVETHQDHRIAMSLAIAALGAYESTIIRQVEVVNKSYPDFFDDLKKIGAKLKVLI